MSLPFIIIKLDKERQFRLSNKAFIVFEQMSGKKLSALDFNTLGIQEINILVYAGLKVCDNSITLDEVIDIIDVHGNLGEIANILTEAINNSSFFSQANLPVKEAMIN